MNIKARLSPILATALLAVGTSQAFASPLSEEEANNPIGQAQSLPGGASNLQVSGTISLSDDPNDVDFYSFYARKGDVLEVDIDFGTSSSEDGAFNDSVDTNIAVFAPDGTLMRMNDDVFILDQGSTAFGDPYLGDVYIPEDGIYTVGVASFPLYFTNGGGTGSTFPGFPPEQGDYQLNIDGISAPTMERTQIYIEVKPGKKNVSRPVNLRSKGKVKVALMGSEDFDVNDVDRDSITFGATGDEDSLHKCKKRTRDINRDGYEDLVCRFYTAKTGFDPGSVEGHLKGEMVTEGSNGFEGSAWLKVVPARKKRVNKRGS